MNKSDYSRLSDDGSQDDGYEPKHQQTPSFTPWPRPEFWAWANTLWPLILHLASTMAIMNLFLHYVNGNHFNVEERQPNVPLANGEAAQLRRFKPLQTDVTTFLSGALVAHRLISAAWASALYWRGAFFLLERPGLQKRDLGLMLRNGLFTPLTYGKDIRIFSVGVILLVTLVAQAASPILMGSVEWVPSYKPVEVNLPNDKLTVEVWGTWSPTQWDRFMEDSGRREWTARRAAGHVHIAWGRSVERDVMKRVIPKLGSINNGSIIANVTLPYFSVTSLEWIPDPNTLPSEQRNISYIQSIFSTYEKPTPLEPGAAVLIPDSPWSATPFLPSPSNVSETRMLVLNTHNPPPGQNCTAPAQKIFDSLPPTSSMGIWEFNGSCYGFARVTYRAGAGVCERCVVSGYSTVRGVGIQLVDSPITSVALRLMADVSAILVNLNSVTSSPQTNGKVDDYVIGLLARSYSAAWCSLTFALTDELRPLTSRYTPTLGTLQARVDKRRAYGWFILQLLMTCSGAAFLMIQSTSESRLIGDTTLVAFKLDATETNTADGEERLKAGGLLKLKSHNGMLKVVVEATECPPGGLPMKGVP